jgi:Zn-dependent metalloprotease
MSKTRITLIGLALVTVGLAPTATLNPAVATGSARTAGTLTTTADTTVPGDVRELLVRRSILGEHTWYQQFADDYPVVGGEYAIHRGTDGTTEVYDGRVEVGALDADEATLDANEARAAVTKRAGAPAYKSVDGSRLWVLPGSGGAHLVYAVHTVSGKVATDHFVDATTGDVLKSQKVSTDFKGEGRVFDPNPVVAEQNQRLKDRGDANKAVKRSSYTKVTLRRLTSRKTLVGKWAQVVNKDRPVDRSREFLFRRKSDKFEMVSAYHGTDVVQQFFQRIGVEEANASSQKVETNTSLDDNSFFDPQTDKITFGSGGVDDAEDLEVVWHEYGHATQFDITPGWGLSEDQGAMGEGFGDFLAAMMSTFNTNDTPRTPLACVADWDAISYDPDAPHCLRRVDEDKVYPGDLVGEVHADGEIWSRALWDVYQAVGRKKAVRLVLEAQFIANRRSTFNSVAADVVAAAEVMAPDDVAAVRKAFSDRGFLAPSGQ